MGLNIIKKVLLGASLAVSLFFSATPTMARVNIDINISLPPLIEFVAPPAVVAIPETNVYVDPDIDVDIFFCNGWWWRPWQGRWYRSLDYRSGWAYYPHTPSFYNGLPTGWRHAYKERRYKEREWNYQRIPHEQLQQNWRTWQKTRYWEKQQNWGVKGLKSQSRSEQSSYAVQQKQSQQQGKSTQKSKSGNRNRERDDKD